MPMRTERFLRFFAETFSACDCPKKNIAFSLKEQPVGPTAPLSRGILLSENERKDVRRGAACAHGL